MCSLCIYVCVCCVLFFSVYEGLPTWHRDYSVRGGGENAESIEWFIDDQASCGRMIRLLAYPLSFWSASCLSSQSSYVTGRAYILTGDWRGEGGRGAKSYDRRESLALCESFNTLWRNGMGWPLWIQPHLCSLYSRCWGPERNFYRKLSALGDRWTPKLNKAKNITSNRAK
jgi:hypothetical protein